MPRCDIIWLAFIVEPHTYNLSRSLHAYRNMSADYVANVMYLEIVKKTIMSLFGVMHAVNTRFRYEILYDMAWRAKQKVLEKRFSTYKELYHNLPSLLEVI